MPKHRTAPHSGQKRTPARRPNRLVAALVYDNLCTFEFGVTAEIFALPRPEMGADWYRFVTCSERPRPVAACGGVRVQAEAGLEVLGQAGTIVIPGWRSDGAEPSPALREAIVAAHRRGARIVTICSGAFLAAACGLLDGRRAATHWAYAARLQALHPAVQVDDSVLYVDGGDILTSAGSAAGIDLLLHVVRKDFGAAAANAVARRLVVPPHRDGGQAQFIARPVAQRPGGQIGRVMDSVRKSPADRWTVKRLAEAAAMSERTLVRRFTEAAGMAPGEWVLQVRIDAARYLLETGEAPLEDVAQMAGFGSLATLQHHFRQRVGVSPRRYREQFRRAAA